MFYGAKLDEDIQYKDVKKHHHNIDKSYVLLNHQKHSIQTKIKIIMNPLSCKLVYGPKLLLCLAALSFAWLTEFHKCAPEFRTSSLLHDIVMNSKIDKVPNAKQTHLLLHQHSNSMQCAFWIVTQLYLYHFCTFIAQNRIFYYFLQK